jgi:hypothetical protein
VFGTYRRPGVIRVPPRLCMAWLVDPATGAVDARYAATFVCAGPVAPRPRPQVAR